MNKGIEDKISSKQKGKITESRVAELITLGSKGQLTCYIPTSDDDGIDLIVNVKSNFRPLFIQVKSRFKLNKNNRFIQNVGSATFKSNLHFYIVFMYFSPVSLEVDTIWLIPSVEFEKLAYLKKAGDNYKEFYRFSANPISEIDKWAKFKVDKSLLGKIILKECLKDTNKSN